MQINESKLIPLAKTPTGISGMDDVTEGGIPKGRPTLVCGGAGAGKTLFGMVFLVNGIVQYDEPGVFVAFEETAEELAQNVTSLGFDLKDLITRKKLLVDFIQVERTEIEETGDYDLSGLFIRLNTAIDSLGAKRVVLDTIETLFGAFSNHAIVRAELRRLFRWLKDKGVTAIVTAERGEGSLTRYGLEEYVADCVILLDHRVIDQISTRRLRVVKYRGSTHGTNEYPFLIGNNGFSVLPITSLGLDHIVPTERISSGVEGLDDMLGGNGYYRGSTILISGTVGAGKSSLAASFVDYACKRGERCLYFAFEESSNQIIRNMRSIGINLEPHVKNDLLQFHVSRPTLFGLEMHLITMYDTIKQFRPSIVILDPITEFTSIAPKIEVKSAVTRLIDYLKSNQITALFTSNTIEDYEQEQSEAGISSLVDTWVLVQNVEMNGERNRGIYILESRGMAHSNQIHEFWLTVNGIKIGGAKKTISEM
jgi:circadian clock protein KaiC